MHLRYPFLAFFKKIKIACSMSAFVANFQVFQLHSKNSSSSWYRNLKMCMFAQHASVHKRKLSKCVDNYFLECQAQFGAILGHLGPKWVIGMYHRPKQQMNLQTQPSWPIAYETSMKLPRSFRKILRNFQETSIFFWFIFHLIYFASPTKQQMNFETQPQWPIVYEN
jgi:hypothetical protein